MKIARLLAILGTLPLLVAGATAQEKSPVHPPFISQQVPNEAAPGHMADRPLAKAAQGAPLRLANGAVPTGLQGWYDYQSNGQSPTWIRVNPNDPNDIHTVFMLSTDGSVFDQIAPTRRVGYAHSTDGGQTWSPTLDISGIDLRLGFPYIQLADVGLGYGPLIATHGDPDGAGVRTMFYAGTGNGSISQLFTMNRPTAGGRTGDAGAGAIWPAFAPHGDNEKVQEVISSLSFRTGEAPAPLQIATADFDEGTVPPWRDFNIDSLIVATSGGRYIMDRSPSGKLGVVFHHFLTFDDVTLNAIRISESTDNGATWSEPAIIFTDEDYFEENLNGDVDTLAPQSDLDFAYMGEDPHVVFGGTINNLFRFQSIYHWSPSTGVVPVATTDLDSLRGINVHPQLLFQPGGVMGVSYPSISLGDDGKHIVVAYMAQGQVNIDPNPPLIASEDGFGYFRIWMVGSTDGGETWGANRVLHDWAGGEGIDSASIEYPSLNETCRVDPETGDVTIDMAFQARRKPGMYAFIVEDVNGTGTPANRGPIEECFQYHQRTALGPDWFQSSLSVDDEKTFVRNYDARIKCYPNPASNSASILFTTPRSGLVTVKIYDALGRDVMTAVDNERLYAASHLREVALDALPAGTYRVVVSQGEASSSQPLNVVH